MSISGVSKGVALYLIGVFCCIAFLNVNDFTVTERQFTIFLVSFSFIIGFYTGFSSKHYSVLNGFLIGIICSTAMLFMVSPYITLYWDFNFMLIVVWVSVSIAGSFLGGYLYRVLEKKRNAILKKAENLQMKKTY